MSEPNEVCMPAELVERILQAAPADVVLIGGQALAFWVDYYEIRSDPGQPAISRDVDFLAHNAGQSASLKKFAAAMGGHVHMEDVRNLTALIGSAIAPAGQDTVYNVDLLHRVVGLKRETVEANAVEICMPGTMSNVRIMHPLDVLKSRNANLHILKDKQNAEGIEQLKLSIEVARAYLEEEVRTLGNAPDNNTSKLDRAVLSLLHPVISYSQMDASRKNAARYGVHLADAIPAWLINSEAFWEHQWPYLRERMSVDFAEQCEERAERLDPLTR